MSKRTKTLSQYREMEPEVFTQEEAELRTAIWKTKLQKGTGQITDPVGLSMNKRNLARLLTVRRQRAAEAGGGRS